MKISLSCANSGSAQLHLACTKALGMHFQAVVLWNPHEKSPYQFIYIYFFPLRICSRCRQIGLLLKIHAGASLMASIIQFKYTIVRRLEHTMLIQHQRPLPGCLLTENCTCYEQERGIQLLLTALPNWFWLTRFKMKIEMLLPFFFFWWEFALLSTKWVSFLVITEKCIITFDYAAIKDAQ